MRVLLVDRKGKKMYNDMVNWINLDYYIESAENGDKMDNGVNVQMEYSMKNKKKAYGAVCKVTILLFVFMLLSEVTTTLSVLFLETFNHELEILLVRLISLFGIDDTASLVAAKNFLSSNSMFEVLQMFLSIVTMVVPAIVFAKAAKLNADDCFPVKGKLVKNMLPLVGLCQTSIMFILLFSTFFETVFFTPMFGVKEYSDALAVSSEFNLFEFLIAVVSNSIFVPIIEEYVFRGVIFTYLRKYGTAFAVIASALIFGIAHSSPTQSVFAFAFGMFAAFLFVLTGNIKSSVIFHAINNFIYVIDSYTFGTEAAALTNVLQLFFFGLSVAGIYYVARHGGHMDVFREKSGEYDTKLEVRPGIREVMTVPVIVYLLIYAVKYISEMMM